MRSNSKSSPQIQYSITQQQETVISGHCLRENHKQDLLTGTFEPSLSCNVKKNVPSIYSLTYYLLSSYFFRGTMIGTEWATKKQEPIQLKSIFLPIFHLTSKHKLEQSEPIKGKACFNTDIKYARIWNVPIATLTGNKSLLSCSVPSKWSWEPVNISQTCDRPSMLGLIHKSWHTAIDV